MLCCPRPPVLSKIFDLVIRSPERGNRIYYDSANDRGKDWVPGFGLRVTARSARSFIFNYRTQSDIDRRLTIGSPPAWSVATAREEAARLKQLDSTRLDAKGPDFCVTLPDR